MDHRTNNKPTRFEIIDKDRQVQYKNLTDIIREYRGKPAAVSKSLKTTKLRHIMNAYRLTEAYKTETKVAYVGEQFPNEIAFAFNLLAWNIESMSIMLAQSVSEDRFTALAQQYSLSRDLCSFLRGPIGAMLANCYPNPDIILSNDQPCDCLSKLQYMASRLYECPFITLNTPNYINEDTIRYLVKQIREMIVQIEERLNVKFDEDNMLEVIKYENEAKDYFTKTIQLHRTMTLPFISRELHEIFSMNYFGVSETVQLCKTLYEEALEMSIKCSDKKKRRRVLWFGQIPEGNHELIDYIEKEYEIVFFSPIWAANLLMMDPEDAYTTIAKRAIMYHWNVERMCSEISEVFDTYEIEGILLAIVWGCRNMMGVSSMVRELAKKKNVKYLSLNIDWVDRNNYSFTQVKNRVDGFLEIMR